MKTKKAQLWIVGVCILILVLVAIIIFAVILVKNPSFFSSNKEASYPSLTLYTQAINEKTKEPVDAKYILSHDGNKVISEGILKKEDLTAIEKVPSKETIYLDCWSDDYYMTRNIKIFTPEEIALNSSKRLCMLNKKIGNLEVSHQGDLSAENNLIIINISSKGFYQQVSACFAWTAGIVDVRVPNQIVKCEKGNWFNYSEYNTTTKEYKWIEDNYFRCGDCQGMYCELAQKCEYVDGNLCKLYSMGIPIRFRGKVDSCYYFGNDLDNNSVLKEIEVKTTNNKNSIDQIKIIFFDYDDRFNKATGWTDTASEFNGENAGSKIDYEYIIKYKES